MNPAEYHVMAEVERDHWWYRGLRDLLVRSLRRYAPSPRGRLLAVLDAGCGTGENLCLLRETLAPGYLGGFDISPLALEYASRKNPEADLYRSDICCPELHVDELDLVLSCDVIYVPGAQAAQQGLRKLVSCLRPGGLFVLNLPAYEWLRSRHDLAVHTTQRFTATAVHSLLREVGLVPEMLTYRVWTLFPAIVAARLPSMLWPPASSQSAQSDVRMPGRLANSLFQSVVRLENGLIDSGIRFPWGSSVFAIGRKL